MGESEVTEYVSVKLPKPMADEIDQVLEQKCFGYSSRAEVVKDALRAFLIKIKKNPEKES